ncbi:MAG TPA: hypothetical protein PK872_05185 [Ferruginibacter sp.]|nr:hypothetical protein [Ferruginibacter sp.]
MFNSVFLEAMANVSWMQVKAPAAKKKHSPAAHLSAVKRGGTACRYKPLE